MAAIPFTFPLPGTPAGEGFSLSFFVAGTSTPTPVYTDSTLLVAWAQPIVFNADGVPDGPIYLDPPTAIKVVYTDADDVDVSGYPVDGIGIPDVAS